MVISTISGPTTSDPTGFLPIELRPHGILSYLFPPLLPCFHLPFSPFIIPCPERDPGIAYICSAYPSLLLSPFLASSLSLHTTYCTPFCPLPTLRPLYPISQAQSQIEELRRVVVEGREVQTLYDRLLQVKGMKRRW